MSAYFTALDEGPASEEDVESEALATLGQAWDDAVSAATQVCNDAINVATTTYSIAIDNAMMLMDAPLVGDEESTEPIDDDGDELIDESEESIDDILEDNEADLDFDGNPDGILLDTDGDSVWDSVDVDGDDQSYGQLIDIDHDGEFDGYIPLHGTNADGIDTNGDGIINGWPVDSNGDGEIDAIGVDSNGDGKIDTLNPDLLEVSVEIGSGDGFGDYTIDPNDYPGQRYKVTEEQVERLYNELIKRQREDIAYFLSFRLNPVYQSYKADSTYVTHTPKTLKTGVLNSSGRPVMIFRAMAKPWMIGSMQLLIISIAATPTHSTTTSTKN